MPLTPDSELDLLFPSDIIPKEVRNQLHSDLHIRPLASTDHSRGHLEVLKVLSKVSDPGATAYQTHFTQMRLAVNTYFPIVILNKNSDKIVGVGTVFMERKFLRGLGTVGHIEDIAVDEREQGKKIGLRIIQALVGISESMGAYKTILNCSDKNVPFYEKCGFEKKENEMAKYAPEQTTVSRL